MDRESTGSALTEKVGARIKELRTEKGLTQAQLCEAAGISTDAVARIERGNRIPTLDTLEKIAAALQVSVVDLLGAGARKVIATSAAVEQIAVLLRRQPVPVQEAARDLVKAFLQAVEAGQKSGRRRS